MRPDRVHRRKAREQRAASRRLPPVHGNPGRRFQTGGRPAPVRLVGVGPFARGMVRQRRPGRPGHRLGGVLLGVAAGVVLILWIIARVAGHL